MHVVVPTLDLVVMLGKLRPMRSLVTSGFQFAIYTLEAYGDKLKLIVGDRTSITASMEIFAKVKEEGRISINGTDFYESIVRIVPEAKSTVSGSKEITLKGSDTKLNMSTVTYYSKLDVKIPQKRSFARVITDLADGSAGPDSLHHVKMKAQHLSEIFKVSSRLISSYTSDMAGLSGILLRVKDKKMVSVVSDGMRILEVTYPHKIVSEDFDVIIPKMTASLLQGLIEEGDEVEIFLDNRKVRFFIDSGGLKTLVSSSILRASFPEYGSIFEAAGNELSLNTRVFADNISNVRKSLNDDTYRVRLAFDGTKLAMTNTKSSSHVEFSNEDIPVEVKSAGPFEVLVNAFLLEGLLSLFKSDNVTVIAPPDNKPMLIFNQDEDIVVKTAIALASE